ncbi:MAG: NUDIX hydrolase [Anaerolineae bacterium]
MSITIEDIRRALAQPLPGVSAQADMAPRPRPGWKWQAVEDYDCRQAGVLLLLYPKQSSDAELHFVLTRRHEYPGAHSGQISFPGGGREGKEPLEATALRETHEEIGVPGQGTTILGSLSPLYTPPSNYCIYPFVGYREAELRFQPDPREVAEILEIPLSLLLDESIRRQELMEHPQYGPRWIPFFNMYGHRVWGATAMILSEFATVLKQGQET